MTSGLGTDLHKSKLVPIRVRQRSQKHEGQRWSAAAGGTPSRQRSPWNTVRKTAQNDSTTGERHNLSRSTYNTSEVVLDRAAEPSQFGMGCDGWDPSMAWPRAEIASMNIFHSNFNCHYWTVLEHFALAIELPMINDRHYTLIASQMSLLLLILKPGTFASPLRFHRVSMSSLHTNLSPPCHPLCSPGLITPVGCGGQGRANHCCCGQEGVGAVSGAVRGGAGRYRAVCADRYRPRRTSSPALRQPTQTKGYQRTQVRSVCSD